MIKFLLLALFLLSSNVQARECALTYYYSSWNTAFAGPCGIPVPAEDDGSPDPSIGIKPTTGNDNGCIGCSVRVPISAATDKQPKAPTTPATASPTSITYTCSTSYGSVTGSDFLSTCAQVCPSGYNGQAICDYSPTTGAPNYFNKTTNAPQCPPGYTMNSGNTSCNLTNPKQATPDKKQDYGRIDGSNPTITPAPDSDNSKPGKLPVVQPTPQQVVVASPTSSSNPQQVSITAVTGGTQIVIQQQLTDSAGITYTETRTIQLDANGIPTSQSTSASAQSLNGSGGVYTPVNGPTGAIAPNPSSGSGTTFPNDYARAGEAATAAKSITDKLDPLTNLTGAVDGSADTPEFVDGFAGTFTPLTAWQLPAHTSTCPTAEFDVWNHNFQLNSQCTVFNQVKTPLSYAMVVAWVIAALFVVLGA